MKAIIQNSLGIFILLFVFTNCKEVRESESSNPESELIVWDNKALLQAAEKYYMDSTHKINRTSLIFLDKRKKLTNHRDIPKEEFKKQQERFIRKSSKNRLSLIRRLVFRSVDTLNLHKVGKEVAWLPVVMLDRNKIDTLVVDYKVMWQREQNQFQVTELVIQKVNQEKRYEWVEDDGYWEKQLVRDEDL